MLAKLFDVGGVATNVISATVNSRAMSGDENTRTGLIIDLSDGGALAKGTGTIKVATRALGAAADGAAAYTAFAALRNLGAANSGPDIAGATGATAVGMYEADVSGKEYRIEYVKGSDTGALQVRAQTVDLS